MDPLGDVVAVGSGLNTNVVELVLVVAVVVVRHAPDNPFTTRVTTAPGLK
jgi:hypothetical protein